MNDFYNRTWKDIAVNSVDFFIPPHFKVNNFMPFYSKYTSITKNPFQNTNWNSQATRSPSNDPIRQLTTFFFPLKNINLFVKLRKMQILTVTVTKGDERKYNDTKNFYAEISLFFFANVDPAEKSHKQEEEEKKAAQQNIIKSQSSTRQNFSLSSLSRCVLSMQSCKRKRGMEKAYHGLFLWC